MGGTCADGSIVTESSMGIAHSSLPLGTKVEIEYNGNTAIATVVDRFFIDRRDFDLQPAVQDMLSMPESVVNIRWRIVETL